ncbi:MAG: zinc ribbon domain-containing protein [Anaerolineae bacterium]|nr:zinc ribbon domain-containing protein [Anaerolineae bacterium]
MPIYEYYCPVCDARFQHLARSFDAPPPPCPNCGNVAVEKLISRSHLGRGEVESREAFDARAREARDNDMDPQSAARLLQSGGELLDEVAPEGVDRDIYREIVARRAKGAQDGDFQDLVDEMPFPPPPDDLDHVHDHDHEHPHGHGGAHKQEHSHRRARDLGWG